ncbi:hypothetical protein K458DRAFT_459297 [Lentithecium fluviatile CBS 122367]|uniref:Actin-like ATPase domain-containing protein n=1 Tax=Lentithecium fluviatile CBS 122367 TaxID=1168545 RepID=A0A6G1JI64_9PLEO|nr:hypothetical protein K458DRAFT_459297 [Lentithecium fluviatile CBS 122367]
MLGNRLVIGLDYGTTYTGVSFCETSNTTYIEEQISVIQDWPSAHSAVGTKEKVPSEVAYLSDGVRWGSNIPPHVQRYLWTKLELDNPKTEEAEKIRQELASLSIGGNCSVRHPVTIIADFLAKVKDHLIKNLDNQYGKELWRTLPITLVITVPAVWSDAAKDRTLQAVSKAGFNKTELPQLRRTVTTTEPEAAAIYTIKSLKGRVQDEQLEVGDGFVVCDMGGGTVDLISYRVASIAPTSVEEATIGTGAQCGGTFVDRGFLKWLESNLGVEEFIKIARCPADDLSRTSLPPKLSKMIQEFTINAKSGFSGDEEYYLSLPTPWSSIEDEDRGLCDGEIHVKASDVKQMFDFSLRRTRQLLIEQLQQAGKTDNVMIKYIFMVGGFAESPYMHNQICELAQAFKGNIQVIKPVNAWSAIVRGATAKGLESDGRATVKFHKCRRHYGTNSNSLFIKGKHRENEAFICQFTGVKRARDQMNWLVSKGQELSTSVDVHGTLDLSMKFWAGSRRHAVLPLYACDANKGPYRLSNVYPVAELSIDLSCVPESEFHALSSPSGGFYHCLDFEVQISIHSALEFNLVVNGIKYGSVIASYA